MSRDSSRGARGSSSSLRVRQASRARFVSRTRGPSRRGTGSCACARAMASRTPKRPCDPTSRPPRSSRRSTRSSRRWRPVLEARPRRGPGRRARAPPPPPCGGGAGPQPSGMSPDVLLRAKRSPDGLAGLQPWYRPGRRPLEIIHTLDADAIVEATPTNILDGEPAMSHIRGALKTGRHVVTANKGPIALAMPYLRSLAEERGVSLRFSGTVGGGTPMLDLARLGLRGDRITSIAGILNGTTNYVLTRMSEGLESGEALQEAQRLGYAEADPTYDVKGIDSSIKLTILANWAMDARLSVSDVAVRGIEGIEGADAERAVEGGRALRLAAPPRRPPRP